MKINKWIVFGLCFWVLGAMWYIPSGDGMALLVGIAGAILVGNEISLQKKKEDEHEG